MQNFAMLLPWKITIKIINNRWSKNFIMERVPLPMVLYLYRKGTVIIKMIMIHRKHIYNQRLRNVVTLIYYSSSDFS